MTTVVSTLHITLSHNMPEAEPLGRSVSCEDTSVVGVGGSGVITRGRLNPQAKHVSLSSSSIQDSENVLLSSNIRPTSLSSNNLLAPTPYTPTSSLKRPAWSSVKFVPKPLPDSMKNIFLQKAAEAKNLNELSFKGGGRSGSGPNRGLVGAVPTTSTGGTKLAVVAPMNTTPRSCATTQSSLLSPGNDKNRECKSSPEKSLLEASSRTISHALQRFANKPHDTPAPQSSPQGSLSNPITPTTPPYTSGTRVHFHKSTQSLSSTSQNQPLEAPFEKPTLRRSTTSPSISRDPSPRNSFHELFNKPSPTSPVRSTLWKPNRLQASSLSVFDSSVQSGVVSKGVGGGVMEDGTSHAPVTARLVSSSGAVPTSHQRKSNSLPGYYSRGHHHTAPQSFRDAFTTSKSPTPPARQDAAPVAPPRGPTSPRAPRVAAVTAVVNQQQHQEMQQRKRQLQLQQQQQQQQQLQQQLYQQKLQQQQQQEAQKMHLQKQQQQSEQNKKEQEVQNMRHREMQMQEPAQQQQQQKSLRQRHQQSQKQTSEKQSSQPEKKKKSILSGIFRRRKKEASSSSSSSSSSDSEEPSQRRSFLRRRSKKRSSKDPLPPPPPPPPAEVCSPASTNLDTGKPCESAARVPSYDSRSTVRVMVNNSRSLGKEVQPLGIPLSPPLPGHLSRREVSVSHDSLPVSTGSWTHGGSHASLGYYSGGGMGIRSSSTDTISKKDRREALKARVERLREKFRDTSSDEEKASVSSHSMYGSESSLSNTNSLKRRSRAARTERFLRRKSQELETLRTETEKDRRNREVVQARIQEIQRVREYEAERNKKNEEQKMQLPDRNKPRWSAKLVYQESSEYESSVLLQTPSASPAASPHMKNKFEGHIPHASNQNAREEVIMRNKHQFPNASVTVTLAPPYGSAVRRSFQDYEVPVQGDLRGHRSASYDSNINRSSLAMRSPYGNNYSGSSGVSNMPPNRSGLTPPAPPPRDRSRIVSPGDGRPMSFSFENINQEVHRPNSSQSSISNFTKGSSPSPSVRSVPAYLGPKVNGQQIEPHPVSVPNRRSFSELQLSPQDQAQLRNNSGVPPARPAPPGYPNTPYRYTDQPPKPYLPTQYRVQTQQLSQPPQNPPSLGSVQYYTDQTPQYAKIVPISSVPPSPSSDYSSYVSDNSTRLQQANTVWRQKEQDLKNRIPSSQNVTQILSDSSRSNSPKVDTYTNGVGIASLAQQNEEVYGTIQPKSSRPPPLTLKQAESLSSLSGQSDVSSPIPKALDSDSSQSSLAREKKKLAQNRPLSMVLEKSESGEKESPPDTPKSRPQPPKRGQRQVTGIDLSRRQMFQEMMKQKMEHPKERTAYQKEFEELFRKEKERLENSQCNNFEEALQELEEIYESLKLDSEDLLDRAERRDLPVAHQKLREDGQDTINDSTSEAGETDSTIQCHSRSRTPKLRRSGVPDKKTDDMHYRRCQQSIRNQPDVQKALQMTGSYLLLSPAHTTPSELDKELPKDPMLDGEPDVIYDDVSYRNIKQANSIKVIDPQPPFGIPLGPTTQSSPNDYLHVTPKENYRPKMIARKQPDTTMDDLAFRNLRKEQRDQSSKEVNVSELDELLSEVNTDSPVHRRKSIRSVSADRARSMKNEQTPVLSKEKGNKLQTPRRVKHQHESRRAGRFIESFKDAVTDTEVMTSSPLSPRHNPSWLERANLVDNKWDNLSTNNLSTSTETLTEMSSARAVSQPDIRQAIIREARAPPGGPSEFKVSSEISIPTAIDTTPVFKPISVPKLVKVQTIQSAPVSPIIIEKKPYRPLDSIFNNKPKPFYLSENKLTDQQNKQNPVDIAKLDALISTLSKIEKPEETSEVTTGVSENAKEVNKSESLPSESNEEKEPQSPTSDNQEDERLFAKANIQKAIRLSMAIESSNSEGERDEDQERNKRPLTEKGHSPVKEGRRSHAEGTTKEKERRRSQGETLKERERRKTEGDRLKEREKRKEREKAKELKTEAEKLIEREKRDKKREHDRLKIDEREKRRADKEGAQTSGDREKRRKSSEKEKRTSVERVKKSEEREKRRSIEREKRRSEEREKRRSQERKKSVDRDKKSPEKVKEKKEDDEEEEKQNTSVEHEVISTSEKVLSSSSSSGSLSKMVQQSSSSGGVGGEGGGAGGGSQTDLTEAERAELERRERIQRYKDERRKQIAARYGNAEWSSSEESGTGEETTSYKSYRRRRRGQRDPPDSSSADTQTKSQENCGVEVRSGRRGSSSEDVVMGVRPTRSSRLRQAARNSSSSLNNNNNNNNNNINISANNNNDNGNVPFLESTKDATLSTEGVGERGRGEASPELTPGKRPPDQGEVRGTVGVDSADSTTLSGSDGRSGRRRASGEERDKSNKRKSNLNRSTTTEEATDPYPLAHPSDSNEDTPRRRRRRAPVSPVGGNISSVGSSEPLKTPEVVRHVVSRLTPPASPPIHPSPTPTRPQQTSQSTQPPNTFQPIQPAATQGTHSAPSTLDTRSRTSQESRRVSVGSGERNDRSETEETLRKVPPKLAPLRKPEIPDVLRPKENTSLASPGVVNTPPSSRPSSVVLEKPPLAPEGLRPAAFRSSLRKPPDTGTCFMAARREKRDDTKPEFFREIQQKPKKGDRLSKSDMNLKIDSGYTGKAGESMVTDFELCGTTSSPSLNATGTSASFTEEVMSSRLEALTARARDTLERADRLNDDAPPPLPESGPPEESADNVVHECEQYLTVNANKKETSPRMRHREMGLAAEVPVDKLQTPSAMKGIVSDTGQKNGFGGSEGRGKESKRMALEKEMKRDTYQSVSREKSNSASAVPSGPPIQGSLINNSVSPPPEEIAHGLQHSRYGEDDDLGSPESSRVRSPDHNDGKWGSRRCSLDGDAPRTNSPDPQSILKRRSSREDVATPDRPSTPEPHSILKRKTSSRNSSIDIYEGEPKPILKKKSSTEELDHFEPRPILKKKSSTDDELDDRPRSILKGGRSREDLDIAEGLLSPNPILKRSPRCDSEGEGELRPILKRRDTTDGVRLRLHVSDGEDAEGDTPSVRLRSDSAPETAIRMRGRSPPAPSATPTHGILKKRGSHSPGRFDQMDNELGAILRSRRSNGPDGEESNEEEGPVRPVSPSLVALTRRETPGRSGERPLSVAERVAGMEAARQEHTLVRQRSPTPTRSPGARPKVTPPSSLERPSSFIERDRESRRNSAFGLVPDPSPGDGVEAINDAFLDRPVVEAYNNAIMSRSLEASPETPSSVSQKAAFFAQLEQKTLLDSASSPQKRSTRFSNRRDRGTRHATQPVTEDEVTQASRLAEASDSASASHDSDSPPRRESPSGYRAAREAVMRTAAEVMQGLTPGSSPRLRLGSRKTSLNEPEDDYSSDSLRGILKREGSLGSREIPRDSPRSILKHSSSDSRRASFSESDHPKSILKPESPLPPPIGSPDHEAKLLKGVLKKDSSLEDSKEIKSILKPESESLDPDHSSDSSSDDVTLTTASTPQLQECDIAESIRDIDPIRHREEQQHKTADHHNKSDHHHRADLAEALRQVEPIKAKDDLAEALRQIEPIRAKERSREREDKTIDMQSGMIKESSVSTKFSTSMAATVVSSTTTNSSSSNSESEVKTSVIKNEAIMRRRNAHSKRYEDRRSMVELRSLEKASEVIEEAARDAAALSSSQQDTSESSDSGEGFLRTSSWRSSGRRSPDMDASQILRQSPLFRNRASSPTQEDSVAKSTPVKRSSSNASSINARLAALQKNGEDGWKDRIKKEDKDANSEVRLRPKGAGGNRERPVSLMERMSALETSSQQWRGRVTQSDAAKFTVAHKIASQSATNVPSLLSGGTPQVTVTPDCSTTPTGSPLVERKKRSPCQKVFKSKTGGNLPSLLGKSSPVTSRKDFRRSISTPNDVDKNDGAPEGTSVLVPEAADESFDAFFTRTSMESAQDEILTLGDEDLDHISVTASQLVIKRRSVRVNRRQGTFRNPLRTLAAREDLKAEYTEVKLGAGERELRRMKVEELSKGSTMAVEALAGLASKENFSAVSLKKVENNPIVREMAPYTALMLLQVKGRRHAQTRLVQPIKSSVNQGDDFILITPTDVFHYKGEFANVIERAKAAEIAQYILQQKDMGITTARNLIELDEHSPSERKNKFWSLLGGSSMSSADPSGSADEDEYVEASLVAANKIYEVQGDSLIPIPDVWGQMPKYEILNSDKVLVLDFGSELYVWAGKRACGDERKVGLALGRELWEEPYDYSDCDINPITPMTPLTQAKLKGSRPEWGLCAKLTENVETILFKEKFIDWPDTAQQSRIKEVKKDLNRYVPPVSELQPCDARVMLEELPLEPDLVLEMSHLGRGVEYYDEEERRLLSISTNDYKVWHVSEYGKVLMESETNSHLHAGDTYVVRWYYLVTATGRTLQGEPSKHNVTGRSRVAYFFWQGRGSSVSDKGVSALMTVELDEERGPHIRVSMGMEPPAFLNLFQGGLVVHKGHREDETENKTCKLFVVRGEMENEGHLVEIDLNPMFLRSRGCLVLVNTNSGTIHLWHGAKALRHTRKVGNKVAQKLSEAPESTMGWKKGVTVKIKEQFEGAESRDFWEDLGGSSSGKSMRNKYFSLLEDEHSYDWTPRIWHLAASPDSFQATEVVCTYRATALPNPLPVLQLDLYSVPQPALFVVDGGHRVWVWQGWWPAESSEGEDFSATGSAVLRFNFARRAALETALNYCKLKAKAQGKALAAKSYKKIEVEVEVVEPQLVVAGMEPLEFTNLFPMWTPREDVTAIQEKEGRWKQGSQYLVSDILDQLSRTHYSLAELTARPLPDGADPLHLEVYLNEEEFSEALGMTRDEFYSLQTWKQTELKKKANLF